VLVYVELNPRGEMAVLGGFNASGHGDSGRRTGEVMVVVHWRRAIGHGFGDLA
jgi:hypothetical protein